MFMIIAGLALIYSTMRLLIKRKMTEINSILWFLIGFVTILAGCCPNIVTYLAKKLYIEYSPAFVFMFAILLLLLIVFENTVVISELTTQVQEMALELSIVEEELERLKEQKELEQISFFDITEQNTALMETAVGRDYSYTNNQKNDPLV